MHGADQLADGAWRLALRTPTLPPATSTNTLVVGGDRLVVIEPATPHEAEKARLDDLLAAARAEGREVVAILVTHHHADHHADAARLRERLGVPIVAHPETARRVEFPVDELAEDGWSMDLGSGRTVQARFTPGHAPGHLLFWVPELRLGHAGDLVAGEGTILIDPRDDGHMSTYLDSLDVARSLVSAAEGARIVPAHGPTQTSPAALFEHYVRHRLAREAKLVAALEAGAGTFDEALRRTYDDVPEAVLPLAAGSLEAHLVKLEEDGRVRRDGERILL